MLKKDNRRTNFSAFDGYKDLLPRSDQETRIKTELCRNWENGKCEYGEKCYFAHGTNEIREKPLQKAPKERCENYYKQGYCISGSKCLFSHLVFEDSQSPKKSPQANKQEKNTQPAPPVFIDLECRSL